MVECLQATKSFFYLLNLIPWSQLISMFIQTEYFFFCFILKQPAEDFPLLFVIMCMLMLIQWKLPHKSSETNWKHLDARHKREKQNKTSTRKELFIELNEIKHEVCVCVCVYEWWKAILFMFFAVPFFHNFKTIFSLFLYFPIAA